MRDSPYWLRRHERDIVLRAAWEVCEHRGWILEACHVRTTHVHAIVTSDADPARIMNDFKAYASRRLRSLGRQRSRRWARHGSIRGISNQEQLVKAVRYVIEGQGERMAVWPDGIQRHSG